MGGNLVAAFASAIGSPTLEYGEIDTSYVSDTDVRVIGLIAKGDKSGDGPADVVETWFKRGRRSKRPTENIPSVGDGNRLLGKFEAPLGDAVVAGTDAPYVLSVEVQLVMRAKFATWLLQRTPPS
jgi:hypothetical protein